MRTWRKVERYGHEGNEKDKQSKERPPATTAIESCRIVNGGDAEESHSEKQSTPDVPTVPETNEPEHDENSRQEDRGITVDAGTERTKNVTAIKLCNRHEIERGDEQPDPGSAANRRQEEGIRRDAGMQYRVQEVQQERSAIDDFGVRGVSEAGNQLGMEDAVDERRNGEDETDERA